QLEAITNGLGTIAYAHKDTRRERLAEILEAIRKDCPCRLDLRMSADAAGALVPATPIRLVLDEVVQNAETAVCGRPAARIKIVARVINGRIFRQRRLFVEVN